MSTVTQHAPGTFCWFELGTTDDAAARAFYSALFGWEVQLNPMGKEGEYTRFTVGGSDVGGGYRLMPDLLQAGVPPHWLPYVSVENCDATAARARELGGKVLSDPLDVFDLGRMAVIGDPYGATFALWQPLKHTGVGRVGEPNTPCWTELATRDTAGSEKFYTALLGWGAAPQPMGPVDYTMFTKSDGAAGGMMAMDERWGDVPPHWMTYFAVDNCDARARRLTELGGKILYGPFDAPPVGRMAVVQDPQGAVFSIIQLTGQA
jgi:predicted enzyme related to lactoylglutathione lyase